MSITKKSFIINFLFIFSLIITSIFSYFRGNLDLMNIVVIFVALASYFYGFKKSFIYSLSCTITFTVFQAVFLKYTRQEEVLNAVIGTMFFGLSGAFFGIIGDSVRNNLKIKTDLYKPFTFSHSLARSVGTGLIIIDLKYRLVYMNEKASRITGFSEKDLKNKNIFDYKNFFTENVPEFLKRIENGETIEKTFDFKDKSGKRKKIFYTATQLIEEKKFKGYIVSFSDISQLYVQQETIRDLSSIKDIMYIIALNINESKNTDELFVYLSDSLKSCMQYDNFFLYYIDDESKEFLMNSENINFKNSVVNKITDKDSGVFGYTFNNQIPYISNNTKKDKYFSAISENINSIVCVPLTAKSSVVGVLSIVSESPDAFTQLNTELLSIISSQVAIFIENNNMLKNIEKRKNLFEAIFNYSGASISLLNKDGTITDKNKKWVEFFGNTEKNFLSLLYDHKDITGENFFSASKTLSFQNKYINFNKKTFWGNTYISPVKFGNTVYYVCIIIDITENKEYEEKLMLTMKDLKETKDLATKLAEQKTSFFANLSHELRTPLNGIIGITELLKDTDLSEKQTEYVRTIADSSETLKNIVNDILDITKLESKKFRLNFEYFSIQDLINELKNLFSPIAAKNSLYLNFSKQSNFPLNIYSDKTRVKQIINNLLSNALKFTKEGGVTVDFQANYINDTNVKIKIIVKDTGIGISSENVKKLFTPYEQLKSEITSNYEGTGLGLSITKELINLLKGTIETESEENSGTSFIVTFETSYNNIPIAESEEIQPKNTDISIIVADDNSVNRNIFKSMLEKYENIKLDLCSNGKEVLNLLESDDYDMVFLDVNMPVLDGTETVKIIKSGFGKSLPVIAFTGADSDVNDDIYLFDDYLGKPFTKKDLFEVLNRNSDTVSEKINSLKDDLGITEEILKDIIMDFINSYNETLPEIDSALINKDYTTVEKKCHYLKSALGYLNKNSGYKLLVKTENMAKSKDPETEKIYNYFKISMNSTISELEKINSFISENILDS